MGRRRLPPMPIEMLVDHPLALTFPAAGYGILCRLVLHYWNTGCRPLPIGDEELFGIVRAHRPTWRHWKPQIMEVFQEMAPALERHLAIRADRQSNLRRLAAKSVATRRERKLGVFSESAAPMSKHTPYRRPENLSAKVAKRQTLAGDFVDA